MTTCPWPGTTARSEANPPSRPTPDAAGATAALDDSNPYLGTGFPSQHPGLVTLLWVAAIIAVFGPLGVRRYRSLSRQGRASGLASPAT
jgi:hypothetical protein